VRRSALAALLALCSLLFLTAASPPPRVILFSPEGDASFVRQVSAQLSEPIGASGDPRVTAEVFAVDCPARGREEPPAETGIRGHRDGRSDRT